MAAASCTISAEDGAAPPDNSHEAADAGLGKNQRRLSPSAAGGAGGEPSAAPNSRTMGLTAPLNGVWEADWTGDPMMAAVRFNDDNIPFGRVCSVPLKEDYAGEGRIDAMINGDNCGPMITTFAEGDILEFNYALPWWESVGPVEYEIKVRISGTDWLGQIYLTGTDSEPIELNWVKVSDEVY